MVHTAFNTAFSLSIAFPASSEAVAFFGVSPGGFDTDPISVFSRVFVASPRTRSAS